jgi:hypothetical protein
MIQRLYEIENWFAKKIDKTDKCLANLTRRRKDKNQINKIRDEEGDNTTNTNEIQRIIKEYFKSCIQIK